MEISRLTDIIRKIQAQRKETDRDHLSIDDIQSVLHAESRNLQPTYIHLGIDFGTCFTKVCFRQLESEVSGIIKVNPNDSYGFIEASVKLVGKRIIHPLDRNWSSIRSNERKIPYLKMAILDDSFNQGHLDKPDLETLLIFYLARVIKKSRERFFDTQKTRVYRRVIYWSGSVGLPVKYYDSKELEPYQSLIDIAWVLSERDEIPSDIMTLRSEIDTIGGTLNDDSVPCTAIPEIAAGIFPFVKSQAAKNSMYLYYDIGGGTSDGVAFNVKIRDGKKSVNFYSASIQPLGIIGLSMRYATSESESVRKKVQKDLFNESMRIKNFEENEAEQAVKTFVADVIIKAKQRDDTGWFSHTDDNLIMFIGGGGVASRWYIRSIKKTYYQVKRAGIPFFELKRTILPEDLEFKGYIKKDFHRYAIAYGLSHPFYEYPDIIGYPSVNKMIERSKKRFDYDGRAKRLYGKIL